MQAFIDWLNQLQLGMVWDYVVIIAASMLCIMFHEVSHGVVALKLGDPTARDAGRLTFNPIKHVDIWGLLMMAIFRFGWQSRCPLICGTLSIPSEIWRLPPQRGRSPM